MWGLASCNPFIIFLEFEVFVGHKALFLHLGFIVRGNLFECLQYILLLLW
jgi:hypothetical protein